MRMLPRVVRFWIAGLAVPLYGAACASGGQRIEQLGADELFERGMRAYQEKNWSEAIRSFERFTLEFPTHPRIQEARFLQADSYFGKKEYITAASEFSRLANDYPQGPWADDARFKICESYYRLSPPVQLDQQYTQGAIDHCESLIAYYPTSPFVPRAQEMIRELRDKLAEKVFIAGEFYYRRNAYHPAILYYEQVVKSHPTSGVVPKALLRIVQAYTRLGYKEEAEAAKQQLLRDYPDSEEAAQVRAISLAGSS